MPSLVVSTTLLAEVTWPVLVTAILGVAEVDEGVEAAVDCFCSRRFYK